MRLSGAGRPGPALAVLFFLSFVTPAHAQGARDSLAAGKRAYDGADYPTAIRLLPIGLTAPGPRDSAWVAGMHMLADALQDQGKDSLAQLWARWAARTGPAFPMDSSTYPPRAARLLAAARAAAGPASAADSAVVTTMEPIADTSGRGQVRIARGSASSIAVITGIGTVLTGESRSLPPGTYAIRLTPEGGTSISVTREVIPGFSTVLAPAPRRAPLAPPAAAATLTPPPSTPSLAIRGARLASAGTDACTVLNDGQLACWGDNTLGQLGGGVADSSWHAPVLVAGPEPFRVVSVGAGHDCALTFSGKAWCWGNGLNGELGQGQNASSATPVPVSGGQIFLQIAVGADHTCGASRAGAVLCWGSNQQGQIGTRGGGSINTPTPVALPSSFGVVSLVAGSAHTCALGASGAAVCWGANGSGQLGNGNTREANGPVSVQVTGLRTIVAGGNHTCAITTQRMTECWGANNNGEIGNGDQAPSVPDPTPVVGGLVFDSIATAESHSCALTADGAAYCWGAGRAGELGNGQSADSPRPVLVVGGDVFKALGLGLSSSCGLTAEGVTRCWGSNARGQLGSLAPRGSAVPVAVLSKPTPHAPRTTPPSLVHERFEDGDWTVNPAWSVDSAPGSRLAIHDGVLEVGRRGTHGLAMATGLALPVKIPVTRTTQIQFDVMVDADSGRAGCGLNCTSWPAMVRVRVRNSDLTESEAWYAFSDRGGQGRTLGNVVIVGKPDAPAGTWLREQRFTIRDALPRADTILQISLGGIGPDFAARYDNILLPVPVLTRLELRPDSVSLTTAAPTAHLHVTPKDAGGNEMTPVPLTWSTSDTTIASVDSTGLVRGLKTGRAIVRVSAGTTSDSAVVRVQMAPVRAPARRSRVRRS